MLSQVADRTELLSYLSTTYSTSSKRPLLKTLIFNASIVPEHIIEIINKKYDLKEIYDTSVKYLDEDLFLFRIRKKFIDKSIVGHIIIDTSEKDIWIIITEENKYFVRFVVESLFNKIYPYISRIYLNTSQMKIIIKELKKRFEGNVQLNYISANIKPRPDTLDSFEYDKGTVQRWKIGTEKELDELSKSYRVIIKNLSLKIYDKNNMPSLECYISRNAVCQLKYGFFNEFYNEVIILIIKIGYELKKFFSNRERYVINDEIELFPLQIEYETYFNQTQLNILKENIHNKYLTLIVYGGNPYFAANILDNDDGSSFGLTVLKNKVTITPIIKASFESIWKLTNTIQEILGDGNVINILT